MSSIKLLQTASPRTWLCARTFPTRERIARSVPQALSTSKSSAIAHPSSHPVQRLSHYHTRSTPSYTRPCWRADRQPLLSTTGCLWGSLPTHTSLLQIRSASTETPPDPPKQSSNQSRDTSNDVSHQGFGRTEKAAMASKLDLSARLSKEGSGSNPKAGFSELWRLIKIAKPETKSLALAITFLLISSAVSLSVPFSIGKVLDIAASAPGESTTELFGMSKPVFYGICTAVLTTGAAANYGRIVILRIVGERIVARLRSTLYRRTFVQDAEFFDANRVGDLISRLGTDAIIVSKSITQNLSDGLRAAVSGIAGFGLMAYFSLKLSGVLCLLFPPVAIGAFFYGRAIRQLSRKMQQNLGSLTKIGEERLGNVRTSQSFAAEIQEVHRYNKQIRKIYDVGKREALVSASFFSSTSWMGNMTILCLLSVGGGMVHAGAITVGELTSFLMYTAYAGSSMFGLSSFYSELMKGAGAASRLFELQDRKPKIPATKGEKIQSARGPISFKDLSFSYPTRPAVKIFNGLNFEIPQGSNVAIVGPSGGGKSTIASLLLRFYNPSAGQILIGGKDIGNINAKSLRRKIGVVSQEPVLFSGSILENIAYSKSDATMNEIVSAAKQANCEFIKDFPDGIDTSVGPRGAQLSGGQKQRIAIARALVKNPDILILDEATSALDAESETLVNSAISALLRSNNTTISIAHRLSTIKRCDTIVVLDSEGKVAEQGTYSELSARPDGAFSKLMEWQMHGEDHQGSSSRGPPSGKEELQQRLEEEEERSGEEEEVRTDESDNSKQNTP